MQSIQPTFSLYAALYAGPMGSRPNSCVCCMCYSYYLCVVNETNKTLSDSAETLTGSYIYQLPCLTTKHWIQISQLRTTEVCVESLMALAAWSPDRDYNKRMTGTILLFPLPCYAMLCCKQNAGGKRGRPRSDAVSIAKPTKISYIHPLILNPQQSGVDIWAALQSRALIGPCWNYL